MRERGFEVEYFDRFSYSAYCTLMPSLDYYLYLGRDEGSMGFLDALAAGVPTIVTRQGFHLDVPDGISYPFDDMSELQAVFSDIADLKRKRMQAVSTLTWSRYAHQHLLVWEHLLCRMNGKQTPATLSRELSGLGFVTTP
jgi:glycosyltransferase involved in cell wall biosynthesis